MTLMITRTTRWTAIATLLFLGGQLTVPAAWAQAPSMPASGAPASKAAGPPSAPAACPGGSAAPAPGRRRPRRRPPGAGDRERALAPGVHGGRPDVHRLPAADREVGRHAPPRARGRLGRERRRRRSSTSASCGSPRAPRWTRSTGSSRSPTSGSTRSRSRRSPTGPPSYQKVLERRLPREVSRISLDRVQAALAITEAQVSGGRASGGQERPAARHLQHDAGPPGPGGRQAGPPPGRRLEPASRVVNTWALILVDQKARQALPAGAGTVVRGQHPRRALERGRAAARRARRRHADRGQGASG